MPSTSIKQQRFFYAEERRLKQGKRTKTGLPLHKIKEFEKLRKK